MIKNILLILAGIFCLFTLTCYPHVRYNYCTPIYFSYENLRKSVQVLPAQDLKKPGKIYLKNKYLFINEPNKGIHVFDNSDPTSPKNEGFINIPGNVDIAIKDNILYADSYIDLVAIQINTPFAITVVKRIEDVFPYDSYQSLDNKNLDINKIDRSKGVVIDCVKEIEQKNK